MDSTSLSESEHRTVSAVETLLGTRLGGTWSAVDRPDDANPNKPSPDVILSDGGRTAAVEVTEVRPAEWNSQFMAKGSVERAIAPKDGNGWCLLPADNAVLPWPKPFVKRLAKAVRRAVLSAPIDTEGSRVVLVDRAALVSMSSDTGSHVYCCHHSMNDVLSQLEGNAPGMFMLVDCEEKWEHEFHTDAARHAAAEAIGRALVERRLKGTALARWSEEWLLADLGPGDHMELLYVSSAENVAAMTEGAIFAAIERKSGKFTERWGDFHVLALDARSDALRLAYARSALVRYVPEYDVDAVVWVDNTGGTVLLDQFGD